MSCGVQTTFIESFLVERREAKVGIYLLYKCKEVAIVNAEKVSQPSYKKW